MDTNNYYDKKADKTISTLKLFLIWLAYTLVLITLWNINIILFIIYSIFIINKLFKLHLICKIFGHIPAEHINSGTIKCMHCNKPLYRKR